MIPWLTNSLRDYAAPMNLLLKQKATAWNRDLLSNHSNY